MNHKNLRIIPEAAWLNINGEVHSSAPEEMNLGNVVLLDVRTLDDKKALETELEKYFRLDGLAETTYKIADKVEELGADKLNAYLEMIFPKSKLSEITDGFSEIQALSEPSEKLQAARHLLEKASVIPTAEDIQECVTQEALTETPRDKVAQLSRLLEEYEGMLEESQETNITTILEAYKRQLNAYELNETGRQQMAEDEAKVADALDKLPQHIKQAFLSEPQTIAVSNIPLAPHQPGARVTVDANITQIWHPVIQDEQMLTSTLKEEALHWIDYQLHFSERQEWLDAVAMEIDAMSSDNLAIVQAAIGQKGNVFDPDIQHDENAPAMYKEIEGQAKEALVDYFEVRDHIASQSTEPMAAEALNERMAEIFPHTHKLAQEFEQQMMEMARENGHDKTLPRPS